MMPRTLVALSLIKKGFLMEVKSFLRFSSTKRPVLRLFTLSDDRGRTWPNGGGVDRDDE